MLLKVALCCLTDILADKMDTKPAPIENAFLFATKTFPIRQLPGFDKRFQMPTTIDQRTLNWIGDLTESQLDAELQNVLDKFRAQFKFKRRQMDIQGPIERRIGIETPYFNFGLTIDIAPEDLSQIIWRREINQIRDARKIVSLEFEACFKDVRWQLEVNCDEPFVIVDLIDRIEDLDDDDISVDYDKGLTWCKVKLSETDATLQIFQNRFNISHDKGLSPRELIEALSVFQSQFFEAVDSQKLPSP